MERLMLVVFSTTLCLVQTQTTNAGETILSSVLTPTESKDDLLKRQSRSYYDYRYGAPRPLYDRLDYARLEYDRPRCGRCDDRDSDDDDDYGRRRDDDRRSHKPTYGNRHDSNRNSDNDEDDKRYSDRKNNSNNPKNGTEEENGNDKKRYDDKDSRPSGSRRGSHRDRNRDRYDDRDRYRPDYYDRFLRDPYREREYDRAYDTLPLSSRYPYDRYDNGYPSRDYGYTGYRRPAIDDRGYDDSFGGYGPGVGRGPHDSFRPWDETYRGQAGWDAGGRGYYFASGRPETAPASAWSRPEYSSRPSQSGWQSVGYAGGYRDPLQYRGSVGYGSDAGYRQDLNSIYGQPTASGWRSVGERRPYRDQSGVNQLDSRPDYNQPTRIASNYGQSGRQPSIYVQQGSYGQPNTYGQASAYGQQGTYGQQSAYGQQGSYGQSSTYEQPSTYGQPNAYQSASGGNIGYGQSSSTTPGTSYLFKRDDELVTSKSVNDETTKTPS